MIKNGPIQSISVSIHSIASSESMEWTYFERVSGWNIGSRHVVGYELDVEFLSILWLFVKGLCLCPHPLHTANHHHYHHHGRLLDGFEDGRGHHDHQVCADSPQWTPSPGVQGLSILDNSPRNLVRIIPFDIICEF